MLTVVILSLCVQIAISWGRLGHALVGSIADAHLQSNLSSEFNFTGSLAGIASWPDQWRNVTHKYDRMHYVNLKGDMCSFNAQRDCPKKNCIVSALQHYSANIKNLTDLSLLTHFSGDIAQPLHVTDRAHVGNNVTVIFKRRKMSFHSLWDSGILNSRLSATFHSNYTSYAEYLVDLSTKVNVSSLSPSAWANETARLTCENPIWTNITNSLKITEEYYQFSINLIEKQIVLAGVRLARIIDRALTPKKKMTLYFNVGVGSRAT